MLERQSLLMLNVAGLGCCSVEGKRGLDSTADISVPFL